MFLFPAAIGMFLLVNLVCACAALGVGFAAGIWFFGAKTARAEAEKQKLAKKKPVAEPDAQKAAERAIMASSRLADVAKGVVSDVGDHAAKMKAISADLAGIDRNANPTNQAVFGALDQIVAANAELQHRLDQAEKQIAAQAAEIRTHETEARTDSLTKLANRRAFDDELRRRLSEWERKQTPFTLILMDIDHFKRFNDTHGHLVGDEVLREVAKVLRAQARDMDLPCRYGGEEFGVILPATAVAGACSVAERIRRAVEESVTCCDGKMLKVTVSLGVAQAAAGEEAANLIRRADEGLYKSKEAGRNCGHWHDGHKYFPITAPGDAAMTAVNSAASAVNTPASAQSTFIHVVKRRVTESHRFGIPLSMMHLKIEEFESVTRKYGKPVTRQMLDSATAVIEKSLREMDDFAALENGEFVVMLPGSTQAEAGQTAKRMQISMNNCVIPLVDRELHVRLRHGIAELRANETAQEVLARARHLAIAALSAGRPADI